MYTCECGREFEKRQSLIAHKSHCKVHLGEERFNYLKSVTEENLSHGPKVNVNNKAKNRDEKLEKWISEQHTCEYCGKIMTEKYASGRFCSISCSNYWVSNNRSEEAINKCVEAGLNNLIRKGGAGRKPGFKPSRESIEKGIKTRKLNSRNKEEQWLLSVINNEINPWSYGFSKFKHALINFGYKEYKCENCNISEWNGKPVNLEVHHIDGNNRNNSLDNIQLLCRICHSETSNYCINGIKNSKRESNNHKDINYASTEKKRVLNLTAEQRRNRSIKAAETRRKNSYEKRKKIIEDTVINGNNHYKNSFGNTRLRQDLIEFGYKEWKCEECGRTEYLGKKIPIEVHHVDGNKNNNLLDNIKFLCYNCHGQTDNFRIKNSKRLKNKDV